MRWIFKVFVAYLVAEFTKLSEYKTAYYSFASCAS